MAQDLQIIDIPKFSSGRRTLMYRRIIPVATRRKLNNLLAHIQTAMEHERQVRQLEKQWKHRSRSGRTQYADDAVGISRLVVQTLTSIRDIIDNQARGRLADHPIAIMAAQLTSECLPGGVIAVSSLPLVDMLPAVEDILEILQSKEKKPMIAKLGLTDKLAQLAELTEEFREVLDREQEVLVLSTVEEARELGHTLHLEMLAQILGTFSNSRDPAQVAARTELLAPFHAQLDSLRAYLRSHRGTARDADAGIDPDAPDEDVDDELDPDAIDATPDAPDASEADMRVLGSES